MILPKRMTYSIVIAICLANVVFRYPLDVSHELGSDTTFIHSLSQSIVSNGLALWVLNPTSYFGLYALSYPSAVPFLFASGSSVGGISIEGFMLVFGWLVA